MNGAKVLADTNTLIYLLNGDLHIKSLLADKEILVSCISEIELRSYPGLSATEKKVIRNFLSECIIIELDQEIKELTIELRESKKIKLPDAIIAASALYWQVPLFTADKGFRKIEALDLFLISR